MRRIVHRWGFGVAPVAGLLMLATLPIAGQSGAKKGEWTTYGGDLGNTRYAALDQINADNFSKLEIAWRFKTESLGPRPEYQFESTPLMVRGVVYSTAGTRRAVVALDAATGELGSARKLRRASSRVEAWRTGPTAAKSESCMSRPGTGSLRSMQERAFQYPASGRTASSI
jgi:hypothetical protein